MAQTTDHFFGITDVGKMRDNNEDSFIAQKVLKGQFVAACVIDGVGGYEGGEVAARIARDAILNYLQIPSGDVLTMMKEAVKLANEKIFKEKQANSQYEQMACVLTLALADVKTNVFHYVHVGDTRLYLLRDQTLIKITKDHSFVGYLEDSGRLTEEEAMLHPKRNEINKALGFDERILSEDYMETGTSPFLPGDLLLLCSDGLTDMIDRRTITSVLAASGPLAAKGKALIDAANAAGGKDNITVALVHNNKKPVKQKATKPVYAASEPEPEKPAAPIPVPEAERPSIPEMMIAPVVKKNHLAVIVLSLVCLLLLSALLWQLQKDKASPADPETVVSVQRARLEGEQKLLDSINGISGNNLFIHDSVYGSSIVVTDTISIQRDSLFLKGNGQKLIADSLFKGPAFFVSPETAFLSLENLTLEGFDVGVLAQNRVVRLRNMRFVNCRLPLQYGFRFGNDEYINGIIADSLIVKRDSLPKQFSSK